jgi:hypothetical protein
MTHLKWKKKLNTITVGTIPKSKFKIVERDKVTTLTYKYMTTHYSGSVHAFQLKQMTILNSFHWSKTRSELIRSCKCFQHVLFCIEYGVHVM